MANTYLPDQSEDFKSSGMRLITDPSSDYLLSKASEGLNKSKGDVKDDTLVDQLTK